MRAKVWKKMEVDTETKKVVRFSSREKYIKVRQAGKKFQEIRRIFDDFEKEKLMKRVESKLT